MVRIYRAFFIAILAVPACKSSDAGQSASPSGTWTQLPQFKLQALVPQPAKVTDTSRSSYKQLSIDAGNAAFDIHPVGTDVRTLAEAVANASSDPSLKRTVTIKDQLADGYHLEVKSSSGLIHIDVRRTIAGVEYSCGSLTPSESDAKVIRDACLSLKPL